MKNLVRTVSDDRLHASHWATFSPLLSELLSSLVTASEDAVAQDAARHAHHVRRHPRWKWWIRPVRPRGVLDKKGFAHFSLVVLVVLCV